MIIVSQDKSVIVNFNNVEAIEIGNVEENQCKGTIYARLASGYFYKTGEYKTEERAKEVLQEIIQAYITGVKAEQAGQLFGFSTIPSNTYYQMPEE